MNPEPSGSRVGAEPKAWLDLPEQTAAITHTGSPLLILAGAGSGKTTVMARRMAHLIREQGWEPEQILGLTFSNKAAANLRARAVSELGPGSNVSVQTYHGFGASIVNANYAHLGFTRLPRLIDRAEAWQLLYGALDTVTIAHRKTGRLGSLINEALALGSSCADHLISIDSVRENCENLLGPSGPRLAENAKRALQYRLDFCALVNAYSDAKKSYNCIDFSDQLAFAAYAVANLDHVAEDLRKQYPVVLLDEYQDTNYAQRKLLELLYVTPSAEGGPSLANNVTAVGDDMQSIYGFRGAHLSNITNFEQHIPGAVERRLETNHRSGSLVVDIANYVQAQVPSARAKTLRVRSDAPVAKLSSFIGADDSSEAAEIAKRCVALGAPWSEIAVLCRKRKVIPAIVSALKAAGVPVEVMGMGGLLARPEVIDLMAWLEIICAPTDEQGTEDEQATTGGESWIGPDPSIALLRILQGARFRLGMRDLGALGRSARMLARDRQSDDRRVDLMAALVHTESVTDLSAEAYGRCKQFVHLRSTLRAMLDRSASERSIADVIDAMASEVGLYRDVDTIGYENLLRFIDLAARFTPLSDRAPLAAAVAAGDPLYREPPTIRAAMLAFLEYLLLVAESEDDPAEATQTGADAVQIMSIHQAKGLEFDTVFLAGLAGTKKSSSIFPDERLPANGVTQASVLPPWLQADGDRVVPPISNPKELRVLTDAARQRANEEELRLLYVAVTRARKNLICSTGHWYPGPATAHGPSAFFDLLQASGFVPLGKSEPAATEDPAVSLRRRRLDSLNETLEKRERAHRDSGSSSSVRSGSGFEAPARGVETGLFGEPLPATAGRTKSRKLKPLAEPLRSGAADGGSSSAPGFAVATLPVSALGVVALCPRKYHWTYVLPLPRRRSSAAEFGTAIHAWIEASNRGAPASSASGNTQGAPPNDTSRSNNKSSRDELVALAAFEGSSESTVHGANQPQEPSASEHLRRPGSQFRETTTPTGLEARRSLGPSDYEHVQASFLATRFGAMTPALTESSFAFAPNISPQTVTLTGRMDAVYKHANGTIEIVDFKSDRAPTSGPDVPRTDPLDTATSPAPDPNATGFDLPVDTTLQMATYGLLALDAWNTPPEQLLTTVCYLGGPEPVLHTTRWNSQLAQTQRALVGKHIIKALSGSSGVVPSDTCNYCDFNAFCEGAAQRRRP